MLRVVKYMLCLSLATVSALACIAFANTHVDVNGIYLGQAPEFRHYMAKYVTDLSRSSAGLTFVPYERPFKRELAATSRSDCFVTGSSHEMVVGKANAPGVARACADFTNLAVSGGVFEDFIIAAGKVAERPCSRVLFAGMPAWFFRPGIDQRWQEGRDDHDAARRTLGLAGTNGGARPQLIDAKLLNLINGDYLAANLFRVATTLAQAPNPLQALRQSTALATYGDAAGPLGNDDAITRPDGQRVPPANYSVGRPPPPDKVDDGSLNVGPPLVDDRAVAEFKTIVAALAARGIAVVPVLMPYHPEVVERCRNPAVCTALAKVEGIAREIAASHGYPVVGGFDPKPAGLTWRDFDDSHHVSIRSVHGIWDGTAFDAIAGIPAKAGCPTPSGR